MGSVVGRVEGGAQEHQEHVHQWPGQGGELQDLSQESEEKIISHREKTISAWYWGE